MKVTPEEGSLTRFWVESESDSDIKYLVEAAKYPIGHNEHGHMVFNGACMGGKSEDWQVMHGCGDFVYRCEPKLRKPENMGKSYRCKHVIAVRDHLRAQSLDGYIERLAAMNPNMNEEHMT